MARTRIATHILTQRTEQLTVQPGQLVELLGVDVLGAFDHPLQLGRAGREHERPEAALLAAVPYSSGEHKRRVTNFGRL